MQPWFLDTVTVQPIFGKPLHPLKITASRIQFPKTPYPILEYPDAGARPEKQLKTVITPEKRSSSPPRERNFFWLLLSNREIKQVGKYT